MKSLTKPLDRMRILIAVGSSPVSIGVIENKVTLTYTVYVANSRSNTVSVISAENNTKIGEDIPVGEGPMDLDILDASDGFIDAVYVTNHGSDSISLIDGATNKVVAGVTFHVNPFNSGHILCDGLTTPSPFPSEYLIPLYGIIITTIIGWSIPSIIYWARSKADVRKLNYYHKQVSSLYGDGKLDENDIEPLNRLRSNIVDAYSKGKINEKHYESLKNEISILYEEISRKKIDSIDNSPSNERTTQEQLAQVKNEVEYAYSKGKINEKHYDLLNKAILNWKVKKDDKY